MASDAFNLRQTSTEVTAGDVRAGDVIAGGAHAHRYFIEPDACRQVQEVETLPDRIRIRYTTARGAEFSREYLPGSLIYRLPAMPELPELSDLEDIPEQMNEQDRKKAERNRETYAFLTADNLLKNNLKDAHTFAKHYREARDAIDEDRRRYQLSETARTIQIEEDGGQQHDTPSPF